MNKVARWAAALVWASMAAASAAAAGVCGEAGSTEGPSTAAVVRLANDWVDTINAADDAAYVRFVEERGPALRDGPERWLELRDNLRGIQLCGVKSAAADGLKGRS